MTDHDATLDRLFAAAERFDWTGFAAELVPDVSLRQNGVTLTLDALRANTEAIATGVRYSEIRRVVGEDAIVEQHAITLTSTSGKELTLPDVCVVVRFGRDGRVVSMEEYIPSP